MNVNDPRVRELAGLQIRTGVNLQPGQQLHISGMPIECADYAAVLAEEAYKAGAANVTVRWQESVLTRLRYLYASEEALSEWYGAPKEKFDRMAARGDCELSIFSPDPHAYDGCDPARMRRSSAVRRAVSEALDKAHEENRIRRCTTAVPTVKWANEAFPNLSDEAALDALWEAYLGAMHVTGDGSSKAYWQEYAKEGKARCEKLDGLDLRCLRYHNSIGTDLTVGLIERCRWSVSSHAAVDGMEYFSNLPTQEIYTSPHRNMAEGTVAASMPLYWMGSYIDGIRFTMHDGKVTEATAEVGEDVLKGIISADEGALHLGECALVSWDSAIRSSGVLFKNMLFDENAACHFALGLGFKALYSGADPVEAGVNESKTHMDFMIGTEDLSVIGIRENGEEIPLMQNGRFCF